MAPVSRVLRVEFDSRWEAMALTRELGGRRWFMFEPDGRHWDVCLPLTGGRRDPVLRQTVERWLEDRKISAAVIEA